MIRLSKSVFGDVSIKDEPEDFVVNEIANNGTLLETDAQIDCKKLVADGDGEKKFSVFVMQKRNWNTAQALKEVARRLGRGMKSVGFAGTKDRRAITTQLCSIYGASPEQLMRLSIKDIKINCACLSAAPIRLGELKGNNFKVRVNGLPEREIRLEYKYGVFPNYFGEQRFGMRKNNSDVGIMLLKGDMEGAALAFLTDTQNESDEEAVGARNRLKSEMDFKAALSYFPRRLKYERSMIDYLSKYNGNYANALRKLPRQLLMMFVHSVEDRIFNSVVERRVVEGPVEPVRGEMVCLSDDYGFPDYKQIARYESGTGFPVANLIGYDTKEISGYELEEMEKLGIELSDFKVVGMPEINCKGSYRAIFSPYRGLSWNDVEREMRFSLPAGGYATVFLNEFFGMREAT